jgi:hypothetical protein
MRRRFGIVGRVSAPLVLRMTTGAWPDASRRAAFMRGVSDESVNLPPLFRGLAANAETSPILRRAVAYGWHNENGTLDRAGPPDLGGNLFTAWTGRPVAFLHVEKCGGIALVRWLSAQFHPLQIRPAPHRDLPPHLFSRLQAREPARFSFIWGHYDLPTLARIGGNRFTIMLLREPQARLLSLYHFWRSVRPDAFDPDVSFAVGAAHRLSLADFLQTDEPMVRDLIDNVFVRRLTGRYATGAATDPLQADPPGALAAAMAALDRLDHVGVTERLGDSIKGLAAKLGVAAPPCVAAANVTSRNPDDPSGWFRAVEQDALTPEARTALQARTHLDQALYEKARSLAKGSAPA